MNYKVNRETIVGRPPNSRALRVGDVVSLEDIVAWCEDSCAPLERLVSSGYLEGLPEASPTPEPAHAEPISEPEPVIPTAAPQPITKGDRS